jgi:hypothetical protein
VLQADAVDKIGTVLMESAAAGVDVRRSSTRAAKAPRRNAAPDHSASWPAS